MSSFAGFSGHGLSIQNPKYDEFIMKVDIEGFGYNNLHQDFRFMKSVAKIAMDIWWNSYFIKHPSLF